MLESAPPRLGCVNGWLSPLPRSPLYEEALDIIRRQLGLTGQPVVDAIRWFRGPDVPWIIEPKYENVERWYVKTTKPNDPLFTGRFLIEKRTDKVKGVSAVARHDTTGYQSPDWRGFAGEGKARVVPGLPGRWGGLEYDFVTGEGDSGNRGLPGEVEGCLAGT